MSGTQKVIVALGLGLCVLMLLRPPWKYEIWLAPGQPVGGSFGYHWVTNPPTANDLPASVRYREGVRNAAVPSIDLVRLGVQVGAAITLTTLLLCLAIPRRKQPEAR